MIPSSSESMSSARIASRHPWIMRNAARPLHDEVLQLAQQEMWRTHLQRKRLCSEPQATWTTPLAARSLTSVGEALSRKVRLPSCPALLLPQLYTLHSVTAAVCAPPAATALIRRAPPLPPRSSAALEDEQ